MYNDIKSSKTVGSTISFLIHIQISQTPSGWGLVGCDTV